VHFQVTVEELTNWVRFGAEINVFAASLQAHQAAWFVTKRSIASIDRHDQFELLKNYSDVEEEEEEEFICQVL